MSTDNINIFQFTKFNSSFFLAFQQALKAEIKIIKDFIRLILLNFLDEKFC